MSKKKKVSPVKSGKKTPLKKSVKTAAKPVAKSKNLKAAGKSAKKTSPPASKSASSKKSAKKATSGKLLKKVVKVVKKVVKAVTKKSSSPSSSKSKATNQKNKAPGKATIGSSAKSTLKTTQSKNGADKKLKSHIPVNQPDFKKEVKKDIPATEKPKKAEEAPTKKAIAEKKSSDVLAITNTIPVKRANEISPSKIASISRSITNPIKKTDSYAIKPEKEPNGKFEMEFVVHSSAEMLYEFLSTPSGLSEWFCDDLNIRNGIYTFIWDDQLQQARLLKTVDLQLVRFQWVDKTDGSYFEFKIQRDDLTNDIALIITDFADTAAERESAKLLWHSQIEKLMHVIGSIF